MRDYLNNHPTAFDPETIDLLSAALDIAWQQVEADKTAYKVDGHTQEARDALAKHIVNMASHGERDLQQLTLGALARLRL